MIFYRNYTRNNLTASADKARLRSRTLSSCKFLYIYIEIMIFYRNFTRNNLTASADKARLRSRTLSSCKFICDFYIYINNDIL